MVLIGWARGEIHQGWNFIGWPFYKEKLFGNFCESQPGIHFDHFDPFEMASGGLYSVSLGPIISLHTGACMLPYASFG